MKSLRKKLMAALLTGCFVLSSAVSAISVTGRSVNADTGTSTDGISGFITRLYNVCLDREADEAGLDYWVNQLSSHKDTGISAAYGFIMSDEFQNKGCSDSKYIEYMYSAFFDREPESAGRDYWLGMMRSGTSRADVFSGFANSNEFANICESYDVVRGDYFPSYNLQQTVQVNLFVDRLYRNVLERTCDAAGMTYWTESLLGQVLTGAGVAQGFIFSDEFISRHLCNSHYIKVLYRAFMGREFDQGGLDYWVSELDRGVSREIAFDGYVASQEFTDICSSYGILRGEPAAAGNTGAFGQCTMCAAEGVITNPTGVPGSTLIPTLAPGSSPASTPGSTPVSTPGATITTFPTAVSTTTPASTPTPGPTRAPGEYRAGDVIEYGSYDGETMQWRVLDVQNNRILVLADKAVEAMGFYAGTINNYSNWENSDVRTWLNNDFYNNAFDSSQKANICTVTVPAVYSLDTGISTGEFVIGHDTQDRLYLLSGEEAERYLPAYMDRVCFPTRHAINSDIWVWRSGGDENNHSGNDACSWWLRNPGSERYEASAVDCSGSMTALRFRVNADTPFIGVRPAMWIDISSNKPAITGSRPLSEDDASSYPYTYRPVQISDRSIPLTINPLDYTYEVYPIVENFNQFVYIKTDNPDPYSFRLYDPESVYYVGDDNPNKYITIVNQIIPGVVYEDESTFRVNGGYIAYCYQGSANNGFRIVELSYIDGGELILQVAAGHKLSQYVNNDGFINVYNTANYEDTNVTIQCPALIDKYDYVIQHATAPANTFFENMDSVERFITSNAVYPRYLLDTRTESGVYPYLGTSVYEEVGIVEVVHEYSNYYLKDISYYIYPYVWDSLAVPGAIGYIAQVINPNAVVTGGFTHYLVDITYNGETRTYGGAGLGSGNSPYLNQVGDILTFEGGMPDFYQTGSLSNLYEIYVNLGSLGDSNVDEPRQALRPDHEGWIKIRGGYAYYYGFGSSYYPLDNCWVDGRYIGSHRVYADTTLAETIQAGRADLYIQDVNVNYRGGTITGNYRFYYDAEHNVWVSNSILSRMGVHNWNSVSDLPEGSYFTYDQVMAMNVDCNHDVEPMPEFIYDGTVPPGTPA